MEKELQQSKYEIIVLNHQLMEAIHQKNKVSQLLDQWQVGILFSGIIIFRTGLILARQLKRNQTLTIEILTT